MSDYDSLVTRMTRALARIEPALDNIEAMAAGNVPIAGGDFEQVTKSANEALAELQHGLDAAHDKYVGLAELQDRLNSMIAEAEALIERLKAQLDAPKTKVPPLQTQAETEQPQSNS